MQGASHHNSSVNEMMMTHATGFNLASPSETVLFAYCSRAASCNCSVTSVRIQGGLKAERSDFTVLQTAKLEGRLFQGYQKLGAVHSNIYAKLQLLPLTRS